MTKQQALDQLRLMQAWHEDFGNGPNADYDAICYAIGVIEEAPEGLDNLIKALEQEHKKLREMQKQRWITCGERLPEYGKEVLTVNKDGEYEINHVIDEEDGEWFFDGVVAWMPLPKPWEGDAE